jgi:hypothetical protein
MATLNHIAYNLAMQLEKANDYAFIERVKFTVKYYRALLLRRHYEKGSTIPPACLQTYLMPTILVDPVKGLNLGTQLCRTLSFVPSPVSFNSWSGFQFVGTVDSISPYRELQSMFHASKVINERFTGKYPAYLQHSNYLYIFNESPKEVLITSVVENPEEIANFYAQDGSVFDPSVDEYPISYDLIQQITQSLLSGEFSIQVPENNKEININE